MKTLRWPEPFDRQMHEIHNSNDTGLCNRIFHWEVAYELNKLSGFKHKIFLEESKWPELKELISLPDTRVSPENVDEPYELKLKRLLGKSKPISREEIERIITSQNFDLEYDHLHSNFGHYSLPDLYGRDTYDFSERPLRFITLKDSELNSMIHDVSKDLIGIHIRRGRGIQYVDHLDSLDDEILDDYIEYRELEDADKFYIYKFVEDSVYFKLIDGFIKRNPLQKFYISHDLPDEIFEFYEKKYPNRFITKKYFYDFIKDRYPNTDEIHVKNIIDLFCLSNTQLVMKHELSTWSEFAHYYTDKKGFYFHDDVDYILNSFKSAI